jgi:group I intron endonuclease
MARLEKYSYKYYFIYMIKNLINKKSYVGFHATNKEYWEDDYYGSSELLDKAILKYGMDNFIMGIIEYINPEEWQEKEKYWIREMKTHTKYKKGYNQTEGGDGTLGLKMSNDSKIRISLSKMGNIISDKIKEKISEKLKGRKSWNKNIKCSDETKQKISKSNTGRIKSEEEKNNISERMKKNNPGARPEVRQKVSNSMKGKFSGLKNPMSGSSRSKSNLNNYINKGIELKGDRWEYMRKKIKCTNLETMEILILDGTKDLTEKLRISKNKYYRSLKNPQLLPKYKFE